MSVLVVKPCLPPFTGKQGIMVRPRWFPLCTFNYNYLTHLYFFVGYSFWLRSFLPDIVIAGPHRGCMHRGDRRNVDFVLIDSISIIGRQICHSRKDNT
jgi:hypothetical protein